jgi:hypothetical protein
MTNETKRLVQRSLELAAWGTVIGLPASVWALKKWPTREESWKAAAFLTAFGFAVKHALLLRSGPGEY